MDGAGRGQRPRRTGQPCQAAPGRRRWLPGPAGGSGSRGASARLAGERGAVRRNGGVGGSREGPAPRGAPGACRPEARRERPRPPRCRCRSALPVASERKPANLEEKAAGRRWGVSSRDDLRSFWLVQRHWSAQGRAALPAAEAY